MARRSIAAWLPTATRAEVQTSATPQYFQEIDRYYRGRRGPGALLSRADLDCIDRWGREGLPLEVVLRGIGLAFDRAGSRIRGIAYCEGFIEEVLDERRQTRAERPEVPEVPHSRVRDYLEDLAGRAESVCGPEIAGRIRALDESWSFTALEEELGHLEVEAVEVLRSAASPEALTVLRSAVDAELKLFRETMSAAQLGRFEQNLWRRKLLERYQVPRLSLFNLQ